MTSDQMDSPDMPTTALDGPKCHCHHSIHICPSPIWVSALYQKSCQLRAAGRFHVPLHRWCLLHAVVSVQRRPVVIHPLQYEETPRESNAESHVQMVITRKLSSNNALVQRKMKGGGRMQGQEGLNSTLATKRNAAKWRESNKTLHDELGAVGVVNVFFGS